MNELERLNALTLEDVFLIILHRIIDFSIIPLGEEKYIIIDSTLPASLTNITLHNLLTLPALTDMELELEAYRAEEIVKENVRLAEIARRKEWSDRIDAIDLRMVMSRLGKNDPNLAIFKRDLIDSKIESDLIVLEAESMVYESELVATKYQEDRRNLYLSIADQLDLQYHDAKNGTTSWLDHIDLVKSTYPKPV